MSLDAKFAGMWIQDKKRSDGDEELLALIEAGFMLRQGVNAVRGVELKITSDGIFCFALVTIVPFFKITEKYPLSGEGVELGRRDLRKGKHKGKIVKIEGPELRVEFEFDGTLEGTGSDVFKLVSDDELHVVSSLTNKNGTHTVTKIYTRKN